MSSKEFHLQLIQSVITRMASNSFLLKGWTVTLVSAIFALLSKDPNKRLLLIAYMPTAVFWGLDAYFLHQEQLYRELYDAERISKVDSTYSLAITNPHPIRGWLTVIFNKTLCAFYGIIMATIVVVMNIL